jgi:hypothetical protein
MFFSCYESPAIHDPDPEKRKRLGRFLITQETIDSKKRELGENSDAFWRFVLGFWRHQSTEDRVVSKELMVGFGATGKTEWSGLTPLNIVGGLDPAFSTGGDQCILRLAVLGYDVEGTMVLDFRGEELTYVLPIMRNEKDDAAIQIGKRALAILDDNRVILSNVVLDATGQGRAMGGVLQLLDKSGRIPISIYSTKVGNQNREAVGVIIKNSYELWYTLREFIQHGQIRGLDNETMIQLASREVIRGKDNKVSLESKRDYKMRMGAKNPAMAHSPDRADAAALTLQAAIMCYGFKLGQRREIPKTDNFADLKMLTHRYEMETAKHEPLKKISIPRASFLGRLEDMKIKPF